jgi:23S rRNA pseudouridine2605 synthase
MFLLPSAGMNSMAVERLHKYMASCGVASRRKCEGIIKAGNVSVNGSAVTEPGTKIDTGSDTVHVNGNKISQPSKKYYILNKPAGYVTSNSDEYGRKTVFDIVTDNGRLFAVGRLDRDSEGLLILTNDGSFAQQVSHPRNGVSKTYEVFTKEKPDKDRIRSLEQGMYIDGYRTAPAEVHIAGRYNGSTVTRITLCEGRKRQVRKMFAAAGLSVKRLKRIRIGNFSDQKLRSGAYRKLKENEIKLILQGGSL